MLQLHVLTPENAQSYQPLLPLEFQCCLEGKHPQQIPHTSIIAIGATWNGLPVGIGIASVMKYTKQITIHHLFILPAHRQKQIGTALFQKLQEEAQKTEGIFFLLDYPLHEPTTPAIEKILAHAHWKGKQLHFIRCVYDVLHFYMPWAIDHDYPYPLGYEELRWIDLPSEEKKRLQHQRDQGVFPFYVSPFINEEQIEPINSLVLRYKEDVIGWMITHRIDPDTIRYTTLYVDRHIKHRGLVMAQLLAHSMRLHLANPTPWAVLDIPVIRVPFTWIRFAEKRLFPYATEVIRYNRAWA